MRRPNPVRTTVPTSWTWDFGDPASGGANASTLQNPTRTYGATKVFSGSSP
jgi:PKD repeat protein